MAARAKGRFLLRIEDIDTTRLRPEFVAWIYQDLSWLGLTWEEPVLRQSTRLAIYAEQVRRLEKLGVTYPCFATRAEIALAQKPGAIDPDGAPLYPGLWRDRPGNDVAAPLQAGEPFAIRLHMAKALQIVDQKMRGRALSFETFDESGHTGTHVCRPELWGDVVIARKETPTSYHLSVVIDDAVQGVTHVTRGLDLLSATDVHRVLQVLLDLPAPQYHHHPLILDADGRKLSKSAESKSLREMRAAGMTADQVIARAIG
jgi:glutamyl-Q tRNA(Asp) synthetase